MKDICQKYATKIGADMNSLLFLYGGNQLNMELRFNEQANSIDKNNKEMRILSYRNEKEGFICPKCGEKIKLNSEIIDDLIKTNNNIKDIINGIQFNIENIIKISMMNTINIQLKNFIILLNDVNEKVKKNNERLINLLNETKINNNVNIGENSLYTVFIKFTNVKPEMESKQFNKLIKAAKPDKKFRINDIDITFAYVKSGKSKTITFSEFQKAIEHIAKMKGTKKELVENCIISLGNADN
jgi:Fe2+ or Zn2+ uptake regulation protein